MTKPTSVPKMLSATPPPRAAADFNSDWTLSIIQPCTCSALTTTFSRTQWSARPM